MYLDMELLRITLIVIFGVTFAISGLAVRHTAQKLKAYEYTSDTAMTKKLSKKYHALIGVFLVSFFLMVGTSQISYE